MRYVVPFISLLICLPLFSFNGDHVSRHNVYFDQDSSVLNSAGQSIIQDVFADLPDDRKVRFGVAGPMSRDLNRYQQNVLTDKRAKSVMHYLDMMGVKAEHMRMINITDQVNYNASSDMNRIWKIDIEVYKEPLEHVPVFTSIDEFFPMPSQEFLIDPAVDNRLVGMQGTVLHIPANSLRCWDGGPAGKNTRVELKEVYSKADIIMAGLHTMAGGRMLESGGTIHLTAFCEEEEVRLASGAKIDIDFPIQPNAKLKDGMKTFNAYETEEGGLDWFEAVESTSTSTVTERFYINGEEVDQETYLALLDDFEREREAMEADRKSDENARALDAYLLSTEQLGWINCDRFVEEEQLTNVIVQVDPKSNPSLRMVFEDINSVMAGYYISGDQVQFSSVPVGQQTTIVGYSVMDGQAHMGKIPSTIKPNAEFKLTMQPTTKQKMEAELYALN